VSTQQRIPQRAARLYSLWQRLPDCPLTERQLEQAILRVLDRPGAEADASALRHMLCGSHAVIASRDESGVTHYRKAPEFPVWPDNGPGSPSYDEHLRELAQQETEQHDRVAAEVERNSPQIRQRQELDAHIRQMAGEVIDARIDELRRAADGAAITRARQLLRREQTGATAQAGGDATRPDKPAGREAP
jgi:hypothetical protein